MSLFLALLGVTHAWIYANKCDFTDPRFQVWQYDTSTKELRLKSNGRCLEVDSYSTDDGARMTTGQCHPEDKSPTHQNQAFSLHVNGTITSTQSGKCVSRESNATAAGTRVILFPCPKSATQQLWKLNQNGTITSQDSGLCLDAGPPPKPPRPCELQPAKYFAFCDPSTSIPNRVQNLISNLTLIEKIGLLGTSPARELAHLHISEFEWWNEALHGVASSRGTSFFQPIPCATVFPQVILTAASFNRTLWWAVGDAISTEARAMNNYGRSGLTYWTPNVNLFRDPRWGRGQETPGEDPFLSTEYAAHFIPGLQGAPGDKYLKISASCKHFAAYDVEAWGGETRHRFDAQVSAQDMADTFLPAFQSCVERAHVSSLMCSYNSINGIPACANTELLTHVARKTWGFQGYITSDCGAVDDVMNSHHYKRTAEETLKAVFEAGMDIDCMGKFTTEHLENAVSKKIVSYDTIDERLRNLLSVQFRLGMYDPASSQPYLKINYTNSIATPAHHTLSLSAAHQGIVLLKNQPPTSSSKLTLPLPKTLSSIAIVGPHFNATTAMLGNYHGVPCSLTSPLDALRAQVKTVHVAKGCANIACNSSSGFADAVKAATAADAVVIMVGIDQTIEAEGRDRLKLSLPGLQDQLIKQVSDAAQGKPVVVVYMSGGAVDMNVAKQAAAVGAILWVGYPGEFGATALIDVLFGKFNPSGRLPYTIYPNSYLDGLSMLDMGMRPNATSHNPGRTYRFYTGTPIYSFGTGLSYSNFTLQPLSASQITIKQVEIERQLRSRPSGNNYIRPFGAEAESAVLATTRIRVTNTGNVAGDFVLLSFAVPPSAGQQGQAVKSLNNFERVFLEPHASVVVEFPLYAHDLSVTDNDGNRQATVGEWKLVFDVPHRLTLSCNVI